MSTSAKEFLKIREAAIQERGNITGAKRAAIEADERLGLKLDKIGLDGRTIAPLVGRGQLVDVYDVLHTEIDVLMRLTNFGPACRRDQFKVIARLGFPVPVNLLE